MNKSMTLCAAAFAATLLLGACGDTADEIEATPASAPGTTQPTETTQATETTEESVPDGDTGATVDDHDADGDEHAGEDPAAEDPASEDPAAEDPATQDPAAEEPPAEEDPHEHDAAATAGDADPADATEVISLEISDGAVAGGAPSVDVATGTIVLIEVLLETAEEVHLHGYDFTVEGEADETVQIAFVASIPGVWEVELEGAGIELVEITVS